MFTKLFRKQPEEPGIPELPLVSSNIDKIILRDGDEILVRLPRLVHFWENHQIKGTIVNDQGRVANISRLINVADVERVVAMGWRGDVLVEDPKSEPMVIV